MDGQRAPYVEKFIIRKAIQDGRMNITRFEKGTCLLNLHFLGFTLVLGFVPTQKFIFGSPERLGKCGLGYFMTYKCLNVWQNP